MRSQSQHHDIVVEVNRPQVELFADLADLAVGEPEPFLQGALAVMFPQRVLVALVVVLYADPSQVALLEYSVLDALLRVEATDPFQQCPDMLPDAKHSILLQNKAVEPALVETLLIPEKAVLLDRYHHRFVPGNLFLALRGRLRVLHEGDEKLLERVHAFGEVLRQGVKDLAVTHWRTAYHLLELGVCELAHYHLTVLYDDDLAVKFVLAEHTVESLFTALLALAALRP